MTIRNLHRLEPDHGSRVLDAALDAIVSIDEDGRVVRWNAAAERTFGWAASEAIGRRMAELIVPERYRARHGRGLARYLGGGSPRILGQRVEITALHRDGTELPVELSLIDTGPGTPDRFTAFLRDLTRERSMEVQLSRAQREQAALEASVAEAYPQGRPPDRANLQARAALESLIVERRIRAVFQPIVSLADRRVVGYEALSRFDSESPVTLFASAHALGMGEQLELACLEVAMEDAPELPAGAWLSVNASPELLLGEGVARAIAGIGRRLVIEITEQRPIADYFEVRASLDRLGEGVDLAIDDAGAGYASLKHVVELEPAMVKLDMTLVRGVDGDPVRQAMIAGLVHFARQIGCALVGEGIETEAERGVLAALGIEYGQGYLFAHPAPVSELAGIGGRV